MAPVEKKIDAVLFQLYGVGLRFRDALQNLNLTDADLVAAGSARLTAYLAGDFDARFLR
jgi:hypothetical protein